MSGYGVTEAQSKALTAVLEDLFVETEAQAVLITDIGGNIVAQVAQSSDESVRTLAALAAGSFAATREMAALLGESSFHSVFHQGRQFGIFIQAMGPDFLVVAILGAHGTQGLAKLCAEKAGREIQPILAGLRASDLSAAGPAPRFEMRDADPFTRRGGS